MKTIYIQQLLKVLIEEYEDIDYLLKSLASDRPNRRERAKIQALLQQLGVENDKLRSRYQTR